MKKILIIVLILCVSLVACNLNGNIKNEDKTEENNIEWLFITENDGFKLYADKNSNNEYEDIYESYMIEYGEIRTVFSGYGIVEDMPSYCNPEILFSNMTPNGEIVVKLTWGSGTGAMLQNVYLFDNLTLEQYEFEQCETIILKALSMNYEDEDYIIKTQDDENYYIDCDGKSYTISKSDICDFLDVTSFPSSENFHDLYLYNSIIKYHIIDGKLIGYMRLAVSLTDFYGFVLVDYFYDGNKFDSDVTVQTDFSLLPLYQ